MRPVLFSILLTLPAAQFSLAAPSEPAKPTPRKTLSRSELRDCIVREEELGQRHSSLQQAQDAHLASSAKLSADAMELSRILRSLDANDEVAVNSYNKRNTARNAEVDSHNRRSAALNAAVADLQSSEADYVAACVSRPFLKADEDAVLKELGIKERRHDKEPRPSPSRPPGNFDS
jgi:hypothetical protein